MHIGKILISFCLLLTYSLGFAHRIIPHCHFESEIAFVSDNGEDSHHHHHSHDSNVPKGHDHVQHKDHEDKGLVDLLLCILNEVEHSEYLNHGLYLPSEARINKPLITVISIYTAVIGSDLLTLNNESVLHSLTVEGFTFYQSPFRESPPGRGPPVFSS